MRTATRVCLAAVLLVAVLLTAAGDVPAAESEVLVAPDDLLAVARVSFHGEHGQARVVRVQGRPFGKAMRITTVRRTPDFWNVQYGAPTRAPVERGDVALVTFWARCIESSHEDGEARVHVYFQRGRKPWEKSLSTSIRVGPEWSRFDRPFRIRHDLGAGDAMIAFGLGRLVQTVEIGGVTVTDHGPDKEMRDLPRTGRIYGGREASAAWRKAAERRIEKHRKADLTVRVVDRHGDPVQGAVIHVRMKRHAFGFGSTIAVRCMAAGDENGRRYRATAKELFNQVSTENALKWRVFAPGGRQGSPEAHRRTRAVLQRLKENDIRVHAHVLIWPGRRHVPPALWRLGGDPAALRRRIADHITEMMDFTRGLVDEWDVVNEPFSNHDLMDVLGPEAMVEWFALAKEAAPGVRLYINDFGILAAGGETNTPHQAHYEKTIRFLLDAGAPLGGIGLQSHFRENVTPPETVYHLLDRFAVFGLPLQITEFDVDTTDEELQADYTRDFLTVVFSHPAVNGFVMWGFWEGQHWRPDAAMFRRDWSIKPNGEAYRDLVLDRWWTDETGTTDAKGAAAVRGFLGAYEVTVEANGEEMRRTVDLGPDGAAVTFRPEG